MPSHSLSPGDIFRGSKIELVVGIDFGTTFSGVSYAFLRPGEKLEIQSVTSYSDQKTGTVPSIVYYDKAGDVKGAGADTLRDSFIQDAEENEWLRVEYFKMHLRPTGMDIETNGLQLLDLPPNKTAEQVLGDFLRYLWTETVKFIKDRHSDGMELMEKVQKSTHFVLGHPNGWVGQPQQRMRDSAKLGGLISSGEDAQEKVKFVTEGEASTLTCLASSFAPNPLTPGYRFIVLDAGGGTLDTSTYEVMQTNPLRLNEIAMPDCRFAGSVFVNKRARKLLQDTLRGSEFGDDATIDELVSGQFEKTLKPTFYDSGIQYRLRMNTRKSFPRWNIRTGFLQLSGQRVAECFDFSLTQAIDSVKAAGNSMRKDGETVSVWVVGGFGSSPWLIKQLKGVLGDKGFSFCQPDSNPDQSKAVAHGAVRHYLFGIVTARISRTCYGTDCVTSFDPFDEKHIKRLDLIKRSPFGDHHIGPIFSCIAKKNESIAESRTYSSSFSRRILQKENAKRISSSVYCYDGDGPVPLWFDENRDKFRELCKLEADLSDRCTDEAKHRLGGLIDFWSLDFEVELKLGTTEVEARIKWEQDGVTRYGPVRVVYE